jgi:endonuclease V-like protein UPF0215 family
VLGIDDGPFRKGVDRDAVLVGVVMEGKDLVEGVATTRFAVDGDGVTGFLAAWIAGLRFRPALQAVVLGGITVAGLALVDVTALAASLRLPVLVANRRAPTNRELEAALRAAGLAARLPILARTPPSFEVNAHLHVACAGIERAHAVTLLDAVRRKGELPEPLRLAHLIARAVTTGESRGRA